MIEFILYKKEVSCKLEKDAFMRYTIQNQHIIAQIDSFGAELKSLKKRGEDLEYMWCGDPSYWGRTSPVLFQFVGGLKDKTYRAKGQKFEMGQHGFARDCEFLLDMQSDHEIWFSLISNEESLNVYPYEFRLSIGYRVEEQGIHVCWKVENPSDEMIHFSIGGHPAFYCPVDVDRKQTDYFLKIGSGEQVKCTKLSENGLALQEQKVLPLQKGILAITDTLFDGDALVIEQDQAHQVSLLRPNKKAYLTVTFDAPLFGIWSPPHKKAPFKIGRAHV